MKIPYYPLILILIINSFLSCDSSYLQRPIEPYKWELDTTKVRLAYATVELKDFLDKLNIENYEQDPLGNIFFSYTTSFNTKDDNFIDLSLADQNYTRETATPISKTTFDAVGSPYEIPTGSALAKDIRVTETEDYQINIAEKLSGAFFETGTLTIDFQSTFDCDIDLNITIPSISSISDNLIFKDSYTIKNGQKTLTIPLQNYYTNFTHNGTDYDPNTFNNFIVITESIFKLKEGNTIRDTDKIDIKTEISDIKMKVIFGDFEKKNFNIKPEIIKLDFFDDLQKYDIKLTNPKMTINATNDFGFPIGIDVTNFQAKRNTTTEFLNYSGTTDDEKTIENLLILEGIDTYSETKTAKITNRIIDNSNSNLKDLIGINPTELSFDLTGNINPVDKKPNKNFYLNGDNNLNVDLRIDVPMDVNFNNVVVEENINIDLSVIAKEIKFTKIDVVTNNTIPLSGEVLLQFYRNGVNLNLNKNAQVFEAAIVDANGVSIKAVESNVSFEFKDNEISQLRRATNIKMLLRLNTPPSESSVKIESSNKLDIILKSEFAGEFNF